MTVAIMVGGRRAAAARRARRDRRPRVAGHGRLLQGPDGDGRGRRFGWHHTGDIGYLDEDNYLYIVDRAKDMIISGGFNVYSAEVEQALMAHPAVQDCAVIGLPDEKWGERVVAVVQPQPGPSVTADEITRVRQGADRQRQGAQAGRGLGRTCRAPRSARCSSRRSAPT